MAPRVPLALASLALTVLVAAVVLALVAPRATAQTLIPEVTVALDEGQDSKVASVTDLVGDPDITFTGNISLKRLISPNPVTVTPNAVVEDAYSGWVVTPDPSKLTFNGEGSLPFTIVISAPANLSAGVTFDVTFNATVSGLVYYRTLSDTGYIEVLQYYKLGQYASSEVIHIKQGESRTLNFTVLNRGNGDDTVSIVLGNEAELGLRGITILYEGTKRLEPWQSAKISFILTTDIDATPGDVKFNFTLKSTGSGERVTSSVDFSVVVEKAIFKSFIYNYWWTLVVGGVLIGLLAVVLRRRGGRRRADEEALAAMRLQAPVEKAEPPRRAAVRKASPRPAGEGEGSEGPSDGDDAQADDEAGADGAVEVTIGHE